MFERFTTSARNVVVRAKAEARDLQHGMVGTEHLLLALLDPDAGLGYRLLHGAGVHRQLVRADIQRLVAPPRKIISAEDAAALRTVGIDVDAVLARIEATFGPEALHAPPAPARRGLLGRPRTPGNTFSPRAKKVIELSLREAIRLGHNSIGTEHILLGLIREGEGLAAKILTDAGIGLDDLRARTVAALREAA